jgi:hypothetical protein
MNRTWRSAICALTFGVLVAPAVPARAAVLCASNLLGVLAVRPSSCLRGIETPVNPASIGLQGPKGDTGPAQIGGFLAP